VVAEGPDVSTFEERQNADVTLTATRMYRLGRYEIVAKLGRGGMADAYLAVASGAVEGFRKLVVLKVLHETHAEEQALLDMFTREAKLAARLSHLNIVQTFAVTREDERYCIVMEYLDGVSLSALLKQAHELTLQQRFVLLGTVSRALAGLHYLHEFQDYDGTHLGLVHRDVKPGNIFICYDGQVKVLDFGIAKMATAGRDSTASEIVKGTVQYMAPETLDTSRSVDRRADVFAAGLIAWEITRGRRLWGDLSQLEILRSLATGDLPELDTSVERMLPSRLLDLCHKAIAPDPEKRPPTALALKEELDGFLAEEGIDHRGEVLGALVGRMMGGVRERRAAMIRKRLKELVDGEPLRDSNPTFSLSGGRNGRTDTQPSTYVVPSKSKSRPVLIGAALVAAVGVGGVSVALVRTRDSGPTHETSTPNPEAAASTAPVRFTVRVSAQPAETILFLDGRALPTNPVEFEGSKFAPPSVLVAKAPGYEDKVLALQLNEPAEILVELVPSAKPRARAKPESNLGMLEISSEPPGTVLVDGERVGTSPLVLALPSGEHVITIESETHAPWSDDLRVAGGKTSRVHVDLRDPEKRQKRSSSRTKPVRRPTEPEPIPFPALPRSSPVPVVVAVPPAPTFERLAKADEDEPESNEFKKLERKQLKDLKQLKEFEP